MQREPVDLSVRRATPPCQPMHTVSTDVTLTLSRQSSPTYHELVTACDVNSTFGVRSQPTFVPGKIHCLKASFTCFQWHRSVSIIRETSERRRSGKGGVETDSRSEKRCKLL